MIPHGTTAHAPEPREFLAGVAEYLARTERAPGELWCEKHRIEHTGTGAYFILIASTLLKYGDRGEWLQVARRVAARVCARIAEDPAESYGAWIVLPGSRDPDNHANNAIDCGCAIDALATFGRLWGDRLPAEECNRIEDAVRKVVATYIVPHAMPKEIIAQRLWSLAALGSAYEWLREPAWKSAGMAALDRARGQQHGDGSYPYTPLGTPRSHVGSSDASAFYHSRPPLFMLHALRCFGEDPAATPHRESLKNACDFLLALRRADGTKSNFVEAKPWYWGSPYEVAGYSFDTALLLGAGEALGEKQYIQSAVEMYRMLVAHREPDGGITSHRGPQWNFQCRFFWNAHCAWIARESAALERALSEPASAAGDAEPGRKGVLSWYPDAGLARYADDRTVILLRGGKPRANLNHGSPFGGGGLLHAGPRDGSGDDWIRKDPLDHYHSAEWHVVPRSGPGRIVRLRKAWKENRDEIRFSMWVARVRARSGDRLGAIAWFVSRWHRGLCHASRKGYSSGTATRAAGEEAAGTLAMRGTVADVFGDALEGVETIRRYVFIRGGVRVGDALATNVELKSCIYRLPPGAREASFDGADGVVRGGIVRFGPMPKGALVAVRYLIAAP
jgi:hypothetical protein